MPGLRPSDICALVGTIDPQLGDNAAYASDEITVNKGARYMCVLHMGATDITVDFKLQEAAAAGGSYSDISGKSVTQLTALQDNSQVIIELFDLEMTDGKEVFKAVCTVGNGSTGAYICGAIWMFHGEYAPARDYDLASVLEIVSCSTN
jgi:hypothetical protein